MRKVCNFNPSKQEKCSNELEEGNVSEGHKPLLIRYSLLASVTATETADAFSNLDQINVLHNMSIYSRQKVKVMLWTSPSS
jgi:hypothetical protein